MTGPSRCRDEIVELHAFFEGWFNGELERTEEAFARFAGVMAEGFEIVSPDGGRTAREPLLESVRGAWGMAADEDPPMRIGVSDVRSRRVAEGIRLATYRETQSRLGEETVRLSTVVFRERRGAPNGLEWVHVHETWLSAGADA